MCGLDKKFALVTGGARGIGFACIKQLLINGIEGVTLVDIDVAAGRKSTDNLQDEFGVEKVIFIEADISKGNQVEEAFKKSVAHWKHLDIVINNAGIAEEQNWEPSILTNCMGTVHGTLRGLEYMSTKRNGRGGTIVNLSSISGVYPVPPLPVYAATKSFIAMMGRCLGNSIYEDHNDVKVLTVCPGATVTDMDPTEVVTNSFCPNSHEIYKEFVEKAVLQSADDCAKIIVKVMLEGKGGTVWVISGNKSRQIDFSSIYQQCAF
ncbi:hypothetical protein PPYR_14580 [Photinus pyralis]|uniref:15-hydroxyprostaglandin dehydrogenase [NAD(+)]-like n=1 Tax=Photinus pyralis TaxID=7054 RepID=A0A5N4A5P0_PHOPY|nr:15-hydroxyprostaglandin dehydrogenase [NAD(+)]-like [Photinus pyralis]KAB0792621.1 hypothetical protein PPYR_14580 [Photinus pyralis]